MPEIRLILFPPEVEEKLWHAHGLTQWDVEAVVFDPASEPRWDLDDVHGGRVVIRGRTREQPPRLVFVALRPVDTEEGIWTCITAFAPTHSRYGEEDDSDDQA